MRRLLEERYAYFLDGEALEASRSWIASRGIKIKDVHAAPCAALRPAPRTALVAAPGVWSEVCRRQGSWYRTSARAGLSLLVAPLPLPERAGVSITEVDFSPPLLPGHSDLVELTGLDSYRRLCPKEWGQVGEDDIRQIMAFRARLAARLPDIDPAEPFEELFLSHCANHANFISPRFFVEERGVCAPYSIAPTARVCSACLEIFDVLGSEHEIKYVVPCPGAVAIAGLEPDRYLRIERLPH
jgi:hypothetical protein